MPPPSSSAHPLRSTVVIMDFVGVCCSCVKRALLFGLHLFPSLHCDKQHYSRTGVNHSQGRQAQSSVLPEFTNWSSATLNTVPGCSALLRDSGGHQPLLFFLMVTTVKLHTVPGSVPSLVSDAAHQDVLFCMFFYDNHETQSDESREQ